MQLLLQRIIPLYGDKTFVDVGVNLGQTMLAVKSINKEIVYVGFEPNPACVLFVSTLIKQNNLSGVTIIPSAIGATDGLAVLYRGANRADDGEATIVKDFRDTNMKERIIVPVISSSSVDALKDNVAGIIKIDVEGGEMEVIETLLPVIQRDHPCVICEILPVYDKQNTFRLHRQQKLLRLMKESRYVTFRIGRDGMLKEIDDIGVHDVLDDSNYLFVFEEHVQRLKSRDGLFL
jgi:FkbM family methyltransferase